MQLTTSWSCLVSHQLEEGRSLGPSWVSWNARVCSGEGKQMELDVVADQAPPGLGLAPKNGVCVKILMRDLLVDLSMDNIVHCILLRS